MARFPSGPAPLLVLLLASLATRVDAATVRGTVTDPDRRPVRGARIEVLGPLGIAASAASDERGGYRVDGLAPTTYEIIASAPGLRADPIRIALGPGDDRQVDIALALAAVTESVVVTASQIDLPRSRAPAALEVFTSADLAARQLEGVAEALRLVPGLAVVRSGGRGALASLFSRGGESDFTLVLVDGARLNAFGGGFSFAHLPLADVERIEVAKGPQSAIFGADAIGGVVQLVTRYGGSPRAEALVEAGSQATTRASGGTTGSRHGLGWAVTAERFRSDGFTGMAPSGERVSNDDFDSRTMSASLGWKTDRRTELRAIVRLGEAERGVPGPFGSDPGGTYGGVDRIARQHDKNRLLSGAATHDWTRVRLRGQFTDADFDTAFVDAFGRSDFETRRRSSRVQADAAVGAFGLSAGVEALGERARSTFITGRAFEPVPISRRVVGSFTEARREFAGRLLVTGGVRVEHIRRDPLEADPGPFVSRPAFAEDVRVSVNPRLAVGWLASAPPSSGTRWTRVRASAATGIRPPDAFEIAFTDNPALEPERNRSVEVGVEQGLVAGRLVLDTSAFFNRYDNLIVAVGSSLSGASRYRTDNISNARAGGLEATVSVAVRPDLRVRAAYTWLDSEILAVDRGRGQAPPPFDAGDPLIRRPRHQGFVDAVANRGRAAAFVRVSGRSHVLDIDPSFGLFGGLYRNPGHVVADAGFAWRASRHVAFHARVSNLFDGEYEEALGFPAPGRLVMVGVRLAAGH